MADYFTALYLGHADGAAELAWQLDDYRQDYLREEREEYRRPIVTYRYPAPVAMFDDTTYKKGALVLHMIHGLVGDDGWWKAIRAYLDRFALQTVKTTDLQSVFEEVTGVPLGPVFDQFVYGAGHPELKLRWDYQADRGMVHLSVRQDQELDDETGLFSFPVEIGLLGEKGMEIQKVPVLARREQDLYLPSSTRPRTVVFDPRGWVLATADFDKPTAEWIAQLDDSGETAAQLAALRALGKIGDAAAVEALQKALHDQPFHGLREVAAKALAEAGTESALTALRAGLDDRDSRVRTAALDGLGEFPEHRELLPALRQALEGDSSYKARAAAAKSLGKFRDASSEVAPWLVRALSQESHGEDVRAAALRSLAELDAPGAIDQAFRYAAYGAPAESRDDAMRALARIASHRKDPELRARVRRTLEGFLGESDVRVRERAQRALGQLGDPEAVPALERNARAEPDVEQQRSARRAIDEIRGRGEEDQGLRLRVQQLEREVDVLKSQLDEAKEGAAGGAAELQNH
jgi:aminopeptidase N